MDDKKDEGIKIGGDILREEIAKFLRENCNEIINRTMRRIRETRKEIEDDRTRIANEGE